jgi:hypothetical protein
MEATGCQSIHVRPGLSAKLNSIAAPLRKSFANDQGQGMSRLVDLTAQIT